MSHPIRPFALIFTFPLIALILTACGPGDVGEDTVDVEAEPQNLSIVSGGQQGLYYPTAILFANIWNEEIPGLKVNVETSGGSVANARLLHDEQADFATMQNDVAYFAVNGEGMFTEALPNLMGVTALYPEVVQIVARADSGIRSIEDLRGRNVSVGAPGSGTEQNARQILAAYGLSLDDLALAERLKNTEASDKLKDSHIEAAFFTYGLGAPVITDMAVTTDIVLIPIGEDKATALAEQYPYYTVTEVPAGTYEGVDEPTPTVSVLAWLIARRGLEERLVFEMTEALYNNLDTLHGPGAPERLKFMTLENALAGRSIELHPGAQSFFSGQGLID